MNFLYYLYRIKFFIFGFKIPIYYSNYNDISFGYPGHPGYKITYIDIFSGKSYIKTFDEGVHIDNKFVIKHRKAYALKAYKHLNYFNKDEINLIKYYLDIDNTNTIKR